MGPPREVTLNKLAKTVKSVSTSKCQIKLLNSVLESDELLRSQIISSVKPKIGKNYQFRDLQIKADDILLKCRESLLRLSTEEAHRRVKNKENELLVQINYIRSENDPLVSERDIRTLLHDENSKVSHIISSQHSKKLAHFSQDTVLEASNTTNLPTHKQLKRLQYNSKSKEAKRSGQTRYRVNVKLRKSKSLQNEVLKIKTDNIVVNFSDVDIPDIAYIYLAHGLNFVESHKANTEDLKYDLNEFIRKLSWKAYFHENPSDNYATNDVHKDLRVKSQKYPDYANPLLEEVKTKVLGWVTNFEPGEPVSNLTPQAVRGKKWIIDSVNNKEIFVTRADKGGSILILNYEDVVKSMKDELSDQEKYEVIQKDPEVHKKNVTGIVREKVKNLEERDLITAKDRESITGLNNNMHMKHNPEYRPEDPTMYPLFKVHKLSLDQIKEKKLPPARFVNNTKFGPLYRVEKWMSMHLSTISQEYCKDEYLKDTDHFLDKLRAKNEILESLPKKHRPTYNLFTLDVKALYPSIRPDLAKDALKDACQKDTSTPNNTKEALIELSNLLFDQSYISYKENCYKPKIGIPTGGCNSRQTADCTLHYLLEKVKPNIQLWALIELFLRFIDDIFGLWRGTKRQFVKFVDLLNSETRKYGIEFGDYQFGEQIQLRQVDFLDVSVYINDEDLLAWKLFRKPTDSRLYLQTHSFHPPHVFDSVAYSQMLRVRNRNSEEDHAEIDLNGLHDDLVKSGHCPLTLESLREKVKNRGMAHSSAKKKEDATITAVVDNFGELKELKTLLKDLETDISTLVGDCTKVLVATRKGPSISNKVVKNRSLCECEPQGSNNQQCGSKRCCSCHLLNCEKGDTMVVNGISVKAPNQHLNCKTDNAIYLAQCTLCSKDITTNIDDAYVGQTQQRMHMRINGHRACFAKGDIDTIEKSALALHAHNAHPDQFSIDVFNFMILDSVSGRLLNKRESRSIGELRTNVMGLNRMKIQK